MTYRVRRQAITGKFVLQWRSEQHANRWIDCDRLPIDPPDEFKILSAAHYEALFNRVAQADRRAAAQKKSRQNLAADRAARLAADPDPFASPTGTGCGPESNRTDTHKDTPSWHALAK